jgi:hypothetical protein
VKRPILSSILAMLVLALAGTPSRAVDGDFLALSRPPFEVLYHPGSQEFAAQVAERARAFADDISARLGLAARGPYRLAVVRDREELAAMMPRGAEPPQWAAALAFPLRGEVLLLTPLALRSQGIDYWQVLHHEMVHLVVGEAAARRETALPRWLDEGLAVWMAGEMDLPRLLHLTWAQVTGSTIPFRELESGFPAEPGRAEVAYAESFLWVQYLAKRFGQGAPAKLLGEYLGGGDLDAALRRAFGAGWDDLAGRYDDYARMKATWIPVAGSTGTVWGVTALLFLFAWRHKRAGESTVRERWAQEDREEREWLWGRRSRRGPAVMEDGRGDKEEGKEGGGDGKGKPTIH